MPDTSAEVRGAPRTRRARALAVARATSAPSAGHCPAAAGLQREQPWRAQALVAARASPAQRAGNSRLPSGGSRLVEKE
eukprot:11467023-Alexandrium_andersonii.AAC.1